MKLSKWDYVDTWHLTPDTWCVTLDMWHMVEGEYSLKMAVPQLLRFGIDIVLKILNKKDHRLNEWINELMTKVFVEQPWLYRVS